MQWFEIVRRVGAALLVAVLSVGLASAETPRVAWFDLLTEDAERATQFYNDLFGWRIQATQSGHFVAIAGEVPFAGISRIERSMPDVDEATWIIGVEVDDVRAAVARARSLGARVLLEVEVSEFADWAVIEDPQQAQILLLEAKIRVGDFQGQGAPYWAELWTDDVAASSGFYEELFGWERSTTELHGEEYAFFGTEEAPSAGLRPSPEDFGTGWAPYFAVNSVKETARLARKKGGTVLVEPDDGALAILRDPTGVAFIVVEREKE